MLRYLTSGESHGKSLTSVIEGMPSGVNLLASNIDRELSRRQKGYGRGLRQSIEKDMVEITSGVRFGKTLGSPITLVIQNLDWPNWEERMSVEPRNAGKAELVTRPRPGHADLSGALKYATFDLRDILERSSARETCARVAVGAVAKEFLAGFGMNVMSFVVEIGGVKCVQEIQGKDLLKSFKLAESSEVRCPDWRASEKMKKAIDRAKKSGDSLGGAFEVIVTGVPPGLGSHVQWDRKLDARISMALMSIQAIKGVSVGMGFDVASTPGSKVHDEIFYGRAPSGKNGYWPISKRFFRKTNNAGGIEGGMSNGEPIILKAAMKPIPTLYKPLRSIDIVTKKPFKAAIERSDVCAVPAASVIAEA
ncbi:MAG: chorismate synthase, partial [Thermodesulfobacteriota bacterium]